jgi:hypothetical protein
MEFKNYTNEKVLAMKIVTQSFILSIRMEE